MKTLTRLLFIVACLSLLFSCQKPDEFNDELSGVDLKSGHKCGEVIVVNPSGGDDTQALNDAFEEAKATGPGATVKLTKGTYTIGMIEVRDFVGCFTGAGKGNTIITNLPNLPCEDAWLVNTFPSLLKFVGGDIKISNMTIQFKDGNPCLPGENNDAIYGEMAAGLILADYSGTYVPDKRYIKGIVENVDLIAGIDGGLGVYGTPGNVVMLIYCGSDMMFSADFMPLSKGNISVTNCNFKDGMAGPDIWAFDEKSVINIKNNIIEGGLCPVYIGCMMGSKVMLTNNEVKKLHEGCWYSIWIDAYDFYPFLPSKETNYILTGNKIEVSEGTAGLFIRDHFRTKDPVTPPQLFDVHGNVFESEQGGISVMSVNNKDAKIRNNKFLGTGAVGVMINGEEATGTYAENNQVIGNNLFKATYTDATVYLGQFSKNCKVVGVKTDQVVDLGVNNSVVGTKAHKSGVQSGYHPNNKYKSFQENLIQRRRK
jgi:hypothetical protein